MGGQPDHLLELARQLDDEYDRLHPEAAADRRARHRAERAQLAAMTPRQRRRRQRWILYTVCPQARPWWWTLGYYAHHATRWLPRRWRFHLAWWLTITLLTASAYRLVR